MIVGDLVDGDVCALKRLSRSFAQSNFRVAQLLGGQTLSEYEATRRSRVRQIQEYARYDAETVRGVLDAGLVFCAGDMGWSWQKPTTRERERDEAAIERWVETTRSAVEEAPPAR